MTIAIILTILATLAILADAHTTRECRALGLPEGGIPWRWLPQAVAVPGRIATAPLFVLFQVMGLRSDADPFWHVAVALAVMLFTGWFAMRNHVRAKRERARVAAGGERR